MNPGPERIGKDINVGDYVYSVSGFRMGRVCDTAAGKFQMMPARGDAIWLDSDCIFTLEPGNVTVIFEQNGLARYSVSAP